MNFIISTAFSLVLKWIAQNELSNAQIAEVKAFIIDLEGKAIDKVVKHQAVADLIKLFASNLSETAVDVIVKLLLLKVRANG